MAMNRDDPVPATGYGRPPVSTRFRKGQSGNPQGRPRGSKRQPPYETVLGQMVTVREDGVLRRMTAAEAFLLHITRKGLEGDTAAARAALTAIEDARARRGTHHDQPITRIIRTIVTPGSVEPALIPLRMAAKLDPRRDTVRIALEPWLVEAALARRGEIPFTLEEQRKIWKAMRTPWKVQWPEWWRYRGERNSRMRGFHQWRWYLDEMYVRINGEMHYLWHAVDHEGEVLES